MIVKKVKCKKNSKPKAWQIGDLVDYIRYPHNTNAYEKIAHAGSRNFLSGTHTGQKIEMISLSQESVHSKMPVSHWVFSWQEHEQLTRAQVDELVDIFLERMGWATIKRCTDCNYNTENYHVHIAVNRMHPLTLKVVQPHKGFDLEEAHKIVAVVEQKQGWVSEQNTRYTVLENGELARNRRPKSVQPRQEAVAVEQASGEKSAQRIAQERGHDIIKSAATWTELHQKLAEKGLRFEQKGSGAIVFVGDIAVKASSVDRNFSMGKLCKRLGDFVPAEAAPPVKKIPPEPVSEVNLHEWQAYQAACSAYVSDQPAAEKQRQLDALKARQDAERKRILSGLGKRGFSVLNAERHRLKIHQRDELFQLRRQLRQQMEGRQHPKKGKPRFESWLRDVVCICRLTAGDNACTSKSCTQNHLCNSRASQHRQQRDIIPAVYCRNKRGSCARNLHPHGTGRREKGLHSGQKGRCEQGLFARRTGHAPARNAPASAAWREHLLYAAFRKSASHPYRRHDAGELGKILCGWLPACRGAGKLHRRIISVCLPFPNCVVRMTGTWQSHHGTPEQGVRGQKTFRLHSSTPSGRLWQPEAQTPA